MSGFKETEEEVEVRKEDQERINDFGVLHKTLVELSEEQRSVKEQLDYLEDAEQEMMLSSDTSGTLIQLGSMYVKVSEDEFGEFLEKRKEELEGQLAKMGAEVDELETRKSELKATLYARFGNTINLDD